MMSYDILSKNYKSSKSFNNMHVENTFPFYIDVQQLGSGSKSAFHFLNREIDFEQ